MLNSLRSIVQEVNSARDLPSVLRIIVTRVKATMDTQVCSIYLRDSQDCYTLMATEGLNEAAIGQVSLAFNEGLVGMVAAREEPINLDQADSHPKYQYFPKPERSATAPSRVPIIHHRIAWRTRRPAGNGANLMRVKKPFGHYVRATRGRYRPCRSHGRTERQRREQPRERNLWRRRRAGSGDWPRDGDFPAGGSHRRALSNLRGC